MLDFPRWKVISIWLVLIAGVIWSIPTFVPASAFEAPSALSFIPEKFRPRVNLGLDLAGGSQLLLEADLADPGLYARDFAAFERINKSLEAARRELSSAEDEWLGLEERREALEASR